MTYAFLPKDRNVTQALRRIACAELDAAIALAAQPPHPGQIHALRKSVKKTRGLLRLVQPRFDAFATENAALRDAAHLIAHARDAEVLHATLARLPAHRATAQLASTLPPPQPESEQALAAFRAALQPIRDRAGHWSVAGKDFAALQAGLTDGWTRARKGLRKWRRSGRDDDLHAWRIRVKHHWYHARLLEPIWPEMMAPHIAAADALGEMLGDHHDLTILRAQLEGQGKPAAPVIKDIAKRQKSIEKQALALGERLFVEPAEPLVTRWGAWWRLSRQP